MRRPHGITIIAWLFILVGAAGLLKDLWPLLTPNAAQQIAKLKADGLADLGPAWIIQMFAIIGGVGLFSGYNWARWLLVLWMSFHIGLSILHSWPEPLIQAVIFTPLLIVLFHPYMQFYFHGERTGSA